jgi:acetate kinase
MTVLLFNAGSSSLKFSLLNSPDAVVLASGSVDWAADNTHYQFLSSRTTVSKQIHWPGPTAAVKRILHDLRVESAEWFAGPMAISAVGHRVVHGGEYREAMRIDANVRAQLARLWRLAPLHNPASLELIDAAIAELPELPHVACFDTAFHRSMIAEAQGYAIPRQWTEQFAIRRYGFHGLSHSYCAARAAEMLATHRSAGEISAADKQPLRLVTCHLGHGCSAAAVRDGRCVDTTMGFTPLEGLMMATRSGSLDPGVILHLMNEHGISAASIGETLNRHSGLLGVSGLSADMRTILAAADGGDEHATLALTMYCHRVRQAIGGLTVTLGGIDALVFTAGVGENSAEVRRMICNGLECLGLRLDQKRNRSCHTDTDIALSDSPARILVIKAREDLSMLRAMMINGTGDQVHSGCAVGRKGQGLEL